MEENDAYDKELTPITKVNNFIYFGSFAHPSKNSKEFENLQIDVVINCAAEIEYECKASHYDKFPLENGSDASLLEYIDVANDKIHKYLHQHKKIYIHCSDGNSRAPAILMYYLMSHKNFTYEKAHRLVRACRETVCINENFERELCNIES